MSARQKYLSMYLAAILLAVVTLAAPVRVGALAAAPDSCGIDGVERIVAIGDVHGAYDRFVAILRSSGLVDQDRHWSGGRAHLVQTGDVLDRGADSRKALDLLKRLQAEASRAGGAVHQLLGNHEVMRMLGDLRYVSPGEYEAFVTPQSEQLRDDYLRQSSGAARDNVQNAPLGFLEIRMAFGRTGEYGQWLRNLDAVAQINGILFVHGGISPALAGTACREINAAIRRELTRDLDKTRAKPQASLSASDDGPLWYRGLAQEPDSFAPELDNILAKQHAQAIVIGHTVATDGRIRVRFGGKVIQLDTGMQPAYVPQGRASALEIQRGVFTAIYDDRRDVIVERQSAVRDALPAPAGRRLRLSARR